MKWVAAILLVVSSFSAGYAYQLRINLSDSQREMQDLRSRIVVMRRDLDENCRPKKGGRYEMGRPVPNR